ncbi:hypothetical protein OG21DRAFT_1244459 [Imleria badia]|nr:hypothetical protein OG21DRAFT_1244459 [Imleria badia]
MGPMLPVDLDDEKRTHLANEHEYLNDLESSPSSPPFLDSQCRSTLASHQRSHTTTAGSRSSHLLAHLVSLEEEVCEINAATVVATERLEVEASRANFAERRALYHLQIATENRERVEQKSARLREALELCELKLENAQTEIFQVKGLIHQATSHWNDAGAEAARARTMARKLQEEKLMMLGGRSMGYLEGLGLSMGPRIGHGEGSGRRLAGPEVRFPRIPLSLEHHDRDKNIPELGVATSDEEHNYPRSHVQSHSAVPTRQQLMHSESALPVRASETSLHSRPLPAPPRIVPVRAPTYSHQYRALSPPSPPRDLDAPDTIHPIPNSHSPIISSQPISIPIDNGWIPSADSRMSYIKVPPSHALPSPSSVVSEAYHAPVPPSIPHGYMPSIPHSTSYLSQYDLVNKHHGRGSYLRNEIYIGEGRSGSRPSRESTSRHDSSKTKAETDSAQWEADDEAPPPWSPPHSLTPFAVPYLHPWPGFDDRVPPRDVNPPQPRRVIPTESASVSPQVLRDRDVLASPPPARTKSVIVVPMPLGDVNDPQFQRRGRVIKTESAAMRSHSPPDNPGTFYELRRGSVSSGIFDAIVESP